MSNSFLSQEEIDSLLKGTKAPEEGLKPQQELNGGEEELELTDIDKDLLGEIGNISMGSASTALAQLINQPVNITTPVVTITTLEEMRSEFEIPNIVLEVKYTSGIVGENVLIIKLPDAAVIANLMMGGDGTSVTTELTEIEISAVQEAMNQMIGSSATSMATMFAREVNISPPKSMKWEEDTKPLTDDIKETEKIAKVSFRMKIGNLVDSSIMQILPIATAKTIVSIMMGEEPEKQSVKEEKTVKTQGNVEKQEVKVEVKEKPIERKSSVDVHEAAFESLTQNEVGTPHKNIDLIMDVPLNISVVLGRTKKSIKEVLSLATGSLIELDKLADEPVEVLVNGKKVAYGEVVVVDENFGVRITSIVSNTERVNSLRD